MRRNLPDRFYYQLNEKSPMENYIEQRGKLREKINQRREEIKQQQIIEKKIDEDIYKQLDKIFSKF